MHQLGITHNDISICNIFINPYGTITIGDFGLATINFNSSTEGHLLYISPEKYKKNLDDTINLDSSVDIYALGIILMILSGSSERDIQTNICKKNNLFSSF